MFSSHIPAAAVAYCQALQRQFPFRFRLARSRKTRLGDFRVLPDQSTHITVNTDLNPYAFLITLVHEIAHCAVHHTHKHAGRHALAKPHGRNWQTTFQHLMAPLLTETVFPADLLAPLRIYMGKPAATTSAQPALMQALRRYNATETTAGPALPLLRHLTEGQFFRFREKIWLRGKLRRTRVVCKDVQSGRSYAILADVSVESL